MHTDFILYGNAPNMAGNILQFEPLTFAKISLNMPQAPHVSIHIHLLIGIHINLLLLPVPRSFVARVVLHRYSALVTSGHGPP